MAALTGNFISQSYGGLIHLTTNTGIVSNTPTMLQDGLGNDLGLYVNSNGSISGSSFTGSLFGTASQAVSASWAPSTVTASYALNALTASYALNAAGGGTSSIAQAVTASGRTIYSLLPGETPTNFSVTQSIILGTQTGVNSQGAYQAIFIGSTAGNGARNAYSSTFVGAASGEGAREAKESIFLGNYTGQNAISSSDSIFIGNSAGLGYASPSPLISKASGSIFIGASAGATSVNLDTTIAIGLGAGAGNSQTGSRGNIILGNWAGFSSEWGTNNIMIGNGVTLPSGRRDSINIAGIIYGTGSYNNGIIPASSANPVTNGRIGINKSVPIYSLDVSGSGNYSAGLTVTGSLQVTGSVVINTSGSFVMPLSASASPVAGSTYFSVATKKLFIYDGSAWVSASLG